MKEVSVYIILLLLVMMQGGCNEGRKPASALYVPVYNYSEPPVTIDFEKSIERPVPVKLSEIASEIYYYTVGTKEYPLRQVIDVPEGFITFNNPRTYLARLGVPRKRIGFKGFINNWGNVYESKNLYYDPSSTRIYCAMKEEIVTDKEVTERYYINELPPLDELMERTRYLFPDSVKTRYYLNTDEELFTFSNKGYMIRNRDAATGIPTGITTFNLEGDTMCRFDVSVDLPEDGPPYQTSGNYCTSYTYDGLFTFRLSYNDTIYRLQDYQTIAPAYAVSLGKYHAPASLLVRNTNKQGKAWIESVSENNVAFFLGIHEEGEPLKEGEEFDPIFNDPATHHRLLYLKKQDKTIALPTGSAGLENDLDMGIPFWPTGQTGEYLYMLIRAMDLNASVRFTESSRQAELKEFLENVPLNRYVMIVVK